MTSAEDPIIELDLVFTILAFSSYYGRTTGSIRNLISIGVLVIGMHPKNLIRYHPDNLIRNRCDF